MINFLRLLQRPKSCHQEFYPEVFDKGQSHVIVNHFLKSASTRVMLLRAIFRGCRWGSRECQIGPLSAVFWGPWLEPKSCHLKILSEADRDQSHAIHNYILRWLANLKWCQGGHKLPYSKVIDEGQSNSMGFTEGQSSATERYLSTFSLKKGTKKG